MSFLFEQSRVVSDQAMLTYIFWVLSCLIWDTGRAGSVPQPLPLSPYPSLFPYFQHLWTAFEIPFAFIASQVHSLRGFQEAQARARRCIMPRLRRFMMPRLRLMPLRIPADPCFPGSLYHPFLGSSANIVGEFAYRKVRNANAR